MPAIPALLVEPAPGKGVVVGLGARVVKIGAEVFDGGVTTTGDLVVTGGGGRGVYVVPGGAGAYVVVGLFGGGRGV